MLEDLSSSKLKQVIHSAASDPKMPEVVAQILETEPELMKAIVRAVGKNAEASAMLGRAAKVVR